MKFETFRRSASVIRDESRITIITRPTLGGLLVATVPFAILANALTGIVVQRYADRVGEVAAMGWLALFFFEWIVVFLALAHWLKRTFVFDRRSGAVLTNLPNLTRVTFAAIDSIAIRPRPVNRLSHHGEEYSHCIPEMWLRFTNSSANSIHIENLGEVNDDNEFAKTFVLWGSDSRHRRRCHGLFFGIELARLLGFPELTEAQIESAKWLPLLPVPVVYGGVFVEWRRFAR